MLWQVDLRRDSEISHFLESVKDSSGNARTCEDGTSKGNEMKVVQTGKVHRPPLPKPRAPSKIDYERALKLIRDVLNGSEAPQSVRQVERRLGLSSGVLVKWFPQESALISAQYRAYRAERVEQRMARAYEEVLKVTILLYDQGMNPSRKNVSALLPEPNMLLGSRVWAARRELGLEQ